ncbi:MAG: ADP-ribosylglycohydrolase family protein [Propionibacteriaceae bacterium]|nr:ADP-ribosylglycohydrolase family protein [Propionibacteriaceae bacterium]
MTPDPMPPTDFFIDLDSADYHDRVYGCWQGKNAGGTLGTPLERGWGQEEVFDVWWYPELREGGLPNDDLEMQLIWLKALEEVGPDLGARDLSRYWLDHVGYNFDEYGLSKQNLRWGLEPPVSGHHNNWFIDCMGSPIRSEIWACVAPGAPRLAARYAYQDAICDHAGGEGVYGELFNAALESAAFVVQDVRLLIDIALSYVPRDCRVRDAVMAAIRAHETGKSWQQARQAVLEATPHYNAQYAPINTGFQVIGLLYGKDFGESLCITVNCGYDTDSSGAAIGSYLGVILGKSGLPAAWVEPLGSGIATNEDWGGVKNLHAGPNPIPDDLDSLVARIWNMASRVLIRHGVLTGHSGRVGLSDLYADDGIRALHEASPTVVGFDSADLRVAIDYRDGPVAEPGSRRGLTTTLTNPRSVPLAGEALVRLEGGWSVHPPHQALSLEPGESVTLHWDLLTPSHVPVTALGHLECRLDARPHPVSWPIVFLGAYPARASEVFDAPNDPGIALDTHFPPEDGVGLARPGRWVTRYAHGHAQPVAESFERPGVLYWQTFVTSPEERTVWMVLDPNCPLRCWVNGTECSRNDEFRRIRPNQHAADGIGCEVRLHAGVNEVLVKLYHDGRAAPAELHIAFTGADPLHAYQHDLDRTQFPNPSV